MLPDGEGRLDLFAFLLFSVMIDGMPHNTRYADIIVTIILFHESNNEFTKGDV